MQNTFDLIVIGAGSGGLTAAYVAVGMGLNVALVEKDRIGGDCTWHGCVPSKSLLKAAKVAHSMRTADNFGIAGVEPVADMSRVLGRVRNVIDEVYEHERPEAIQADGIHVFMGAAKFTEPHALLVGDDHLEAKKFIIATGAHAFAPPIEGLNDVDYLTYQNVWSLDTLPERLVVLGGGPIGSEMSQAFARLGSHVTLVEAGPRILGRDDADASRVLAQTFLDEGIDVRLDARAQRVWRENGQTHVRIACAGGDYDDLAADRLLVAVGRRPNVHGLGLEAAGVAFTERGIQVDRYLQTTAPHIYALGDVIGSFQFTHYANWQGFMATRNALLPGRSVGHSDIVPWTTFTEPEVAHVGLNQAQAREQYGDRADVQIFPAGRIDRALAENDRNGFIKLVLRRRRLLGNILPPKLVGATIVAHRAGEMIQEWVLVLQAGVKLSQVTRAIHVYPTYTRGNTQALGPVLSGGLMAGKLGEVIKKVVRWLNR